MLLEQLRLGLVERGEQQVVVVEHLAQVERVAGELLLLEGEVARNVGHGEAQLLEVLGLGDDLVDARTVVEVVAYLDDAARVGILVGGQEGAHVHGGLLGLDEQVHLEQVGHNALGVEAPLLVAQLLVGLHLLGDVQVVRLGLLALLGAHELAKGEKLEYGPLDRLEEEARPGDGARRRRMVLVAGRRVLAPLEELEYDVALLDVLRQDVGELLHHLAVDRLATPYVLEAYEHVEGALGRAQALERLVDEELRLRFDLVHLVVELLHHVLPRDEVLRREYVELYLFELNGTQRVEKARAVKERKTNKKRVT